MRFSCAFFKYKKTLIKLYKSNRKLNDVYLANIIANIMKICVHFVVLPLPVTLQEICAFKSGIR